MSTKLNPLNPQGTGAEALLRNIWLRLAAFFFIQIAVLVGAQLAIQAASRASPASLRWLTTLGAALLLSAALVGLYVALVRTFEQRPPAELAPRRGVPLALAGLALGLTIFCLTYAVLWGLGDARWLGFTQPANLLPSLAFAILAGVGEELTVRGGVFRILEGSLGTGTALILSAALFGGLHVLNPGATWVSTAAIALEAGVLLGAAYCATRNLWLPIGLHIGWNFTEGGLFGAAVSGGRTSQGLINMPLAGPDWATGGAFGPEASGVTVVVCLAAAAVFILLTMRNGGWVPLPFNSPQPAR
jgi:membrane protease YdiL (CAAX protease family)